MRALNAEPNRRSESVVPSAATVAAPGTGTMMFGKYFADVVFCYM